MAIRLEAGCDFYSQMNVIKLLSLLESRAQLYDVKMGLAVWGAYRDMGYSKSNITAIDRGGTTREGLWLTAESRRGKGWQ